jgi:hypothetical protein
MNLSCHVDSVVALARNKKIKIIQKSASTVRNVTVLADFLSTESLKLYGIMSFKDNGYISRI